MLAGNPTPDQIVVIDNGSKDGSVDFLADEFPAEAARAGTEYELIANEGNAGACTARNQGLEVVTGDYIAFCDNDLVVCSSDWLRVLGGTLDELDDVGIVGPKLLFTYEPYNIECAGVGISKTGRVEYFGRGEAGDTPEHCTPKTVQCLTSACWLMRRELPENIGNLDEVFNPAQFEDFDYCYRARAAGWEVYYQPSAAMYHFENVTTDGSQDLNFAYVTIKNMRVFKQRWRHMFAEEDGPADEDCQWKKIPGRGIDQTGIPPMRTHG
jgi:GT2 family glycosyltransferase